MARKESQAQESTGLVQRMGQRISALLRRCHLCESAIAQINNQHHLCDHCWQALPWNQHYCQHCAHPTASPVARCGNCLDSQNHYRRCVCPLIYDYPVDHLITRYKNNQHRLQGLLETVIQQGLTAFEHRDWDGVLAVPMHPKNQWRRGFNQSHVLASFVARTLHIPLIEGFQQSQLLSSQKALSRKQRQSNLKNAFQMTQSLHGKTLLLIDDVVTTGSTIEAASRTLQSAGAHSIDVLALARTPNPKTRLS
ncbi:ComF family protein [Sessilibacter corallicola]|uniref:ComF family protein n=1 Tax=Sessilibacter corallicola TaxID=2904075 RepID=UPI001E43A3EE|nr:ComF family protein [Sessilibacter corallicola]